MKKVLEGELTSLAHSILKAKSDNVHELKEKAGLIYEKLCVLSFAEKHFAGKQPSIGKLEFKSVFETDVEDALAVLPTIIKEVTKPTTTSSESDAASMENTSIQEDMPVTSAPNEAENTTTEEVEKQEELSSSSPEIQNSELVDVNEQAELKEESISPEGKTDAVETPEVPTTPKAEATPSALAEEDFGVHLDDLPDFEPVSSAPKTNPNEDVTPTERAEKPSEKPAAKPENTQPQRTMDLFSQEKKSLNQQLKSELKIGLNDRLAFTQKLFDGDVDTYNKVIAKLNEFTHFEDAQSYLYQHVRSSYNWDKHEAVEQRFLDLLEAKLS